MDSIVFEWRRERKHGEGNKGAETGYGKDF